jgi:hypothetical protein
LEDDVRDEGGDNREHDRPMEVHRGDPAEQPVGRTRVLEASRDDEQAREQDEQRPVDLAVDLVRIHPPRHERHGGARDRDDGDGNARQERQQHHRDRCDRLPQQGIVHGQPRVRGDLERRVRQMAAVDEGDNAEHAHEADDGDRRLVGEEAPVADPREASDQHVLRVPGKRRHAADVRRGRQRH